MSEQALKKAVVFADLVDSTKLYQEEGDVAAESLINEAFSLVQEIVFDHAGELVKTIGDEVLLTFEDSWSAIHAVLFIQQYFKENQDPPLQWRAGLDFGSVVLREGDVFGDTVNRAARIVKKAKPNQLLLSEQALPEEQEGDGIGFRFVIETELKGFKEKCRLHDVLFSDSSSGVTMSLDDECVDDILESASLKLAYESNDFILDKDNTVFKIGREPDNHLQITGDSVSRHHAFIEFDKGKFYLIDQSTNGTYVKDHLGDWHLIKHDRYPLIGSGFLSFGKIVDNNNKLLSFDYQI
ncbi:MAG: adenylate/guanylate cyclase domain-containing protein [Deltaproteobacteria bacterium]|nr:adenylate/guanylate cyclase domain-containing protein [Deltaproteobacteria bacterium]